MENQIIPFIDQVNGIEKFEKDIRSLGEYEPYKAFLLAHAIEKTTKKIKEDFQPSFKKYFDEVKELPAGFSCKVTSGGKKYNFEDDIVYMQIKATLEAREALLKQATDLHEKGGTFTDPNTGEIIAPVKYTYNAEKYNVSRK